MKRGVVIIGALAFAVLIARRLAAPLLILAEGTQAVAQGDFSPRQALPANDELGVLTQSFNRMTRQLQEARAAADRNRADVEAARAYLESVLANLSTGVLAFSPEGHLRAANHGALQILEDDLAGFEDIDIGDTITAIKTSSGANLPFATEALPGFKEVQPQVFAGLYPTEASEYDSLRDALEKLQLNDAALRFVDWVEPLLRRRAAVGSRRGRAKVGHTCRCPPWRLYVRSFTDCNRTVPGLQPEFCP